VFTDVIYTIVASFVFTLGIALFPLERWSDFVLCMTLLRVLGGLLSAYDLAGEPMFLRKAQEIADRLMPAWDSPSGIPYSTINLATGYASNPGWSGVRI